MSLIVCRQPTKSAETRTLACARVARGRRAERGGCGLLQLTSLRWFYFISNKTHLQGLDERWCAALGRAQPPARAQLAQRKHDLAAPADDRGLRARRCGARARAVGRGRQGLLRRRRRQGAPPQPPPREREAEFSRSIDRGVRARASLVFDSIDRRLSLADEPFAGERNADVRRPTPRRSRSRGSPARRRAPSAARPRRTARARRGSRRPTSSARSTR